MSSSRKKAPNPNTGAKTRWGTVLLEYVGAVGIIIMMLHVVANVVSRRLFNYPLPYTTEFVGYIYMPVVAFVGFVVAKQLGEHLNAPILFDRLTWGNRRILVVASSMSIVAICLVMTYFSLLEFLEAARIGTTAGVTTVPIWPVMGLAPVAFLALAVYFLSDTFRAFRGQFEGRTDEEIAVERTLKEGAEL